MKGTTREHGLTFIETMVWVALMTAAVAAIASTITYFYRTNAYTLEQAGAITSAQRGLEQVVRIVREASFSSQGAYPIVSIAPHEFVFYADVNDDPLIERVHYYLSGTTLLRSTLSPSGDPPDYVGTEQIDEVADHVRNIERGIPTFQYFDALGAEIASSTWGYTAVRFVKVTLSVNISTSTLPSEIGISSSAALRNLADN